MLEDADNKQSNFATELKNFDEGIKRFEENSFLNNLGLLSSAKEKVNKFKSRLFQKKKKNRENSNK